MTSVTDSIGPDSKMGDILQAYPGAQRSLFRRYHIGGCSSCAFSPDETLARLCERNGGLNPEQVLRDIQASHAEDARVLIEPGELASWLKQDSSVRLLDVRSREEFEAVHIEGAVLLSQPVMREILAAGENSRALVIVDHQGKSGLDAAAYFMGHGLRDVRVLRGGIDAWAREVDPKLRRYRMQ